MSTTQTLALVDKLVRSFLTGDDSLSNFIEDLSDDQTADLIGSIEIYARQDPATLINVIKMLLNHASTRHSTVIKCVKLIQEEVIRDKESFQCMSELHLALLSYKLSEHGQASAQIEELVKLIMQPMMNLAENKNGVTTTLDLLPSLLTLASLSKNASTESQRTLDAILDSPLSSKVIALSNVLIDMQLTAAQINKLQQRMLEYSANIEAEEFAGMVKNSINFVEKSNNPVQWISILREILKNLPVSELQIVLYILDISLQHNETFPLSIVQYYNDALKSNNAFDMNLSDLFLLLLLIKSEKHREQALKIISKLFTMAAHSKFDKALELMTKLITFQGIEMQSNLILKLALYLCEKQQSQKVRTLGHVSLIEMFKRHTTSRADILSLCFSLIFEENTGDNKQISTTSREFCQTLELIAKNHLSLLSEFITKIQDWLGYLPNYPLPLAKRLLVLFLPLAQVNPQFYDSLLKLFRKFLILKVKDTKILGIHGVCHLLSHNILRKSQHSGAQSNLTDDEIELLALIKQGLSISVEARSDVYTSILVLVKNTYFCKGSAKVEILKRIRAILFSKLKRFQKDNGQVLCMEKCFEDLKNQGVRERENMLYLIGALLATVISLKASNVESPKTLEYVLQLINQIGNLQEMMSLTRLFYNREADESDPLFNIQRTNNRLEDEEEFSELNWLDAPSSHLVQTIKNSANLTCDPFKIPPEQRMAVLIPIFGLLIDLLHQMPTTFDKYSSAVKKTKQILFDSFSFLVVKSKSAHGKFKPVKMLLQSLIRQADPEAISMATVTNVLKDHIQQITRRTNPTLTYFTLHSSLMVLEKKLSYWTKHLIELYSSSLHIERYLSSSTSVIGFLSLTTLQVPYLPLMGGLEMSGYEFGEEILMNLLSTLFNLFKSTHRLSGNQIDSELDLLDKIPEESKVKLDNKHAKYSVLQTCLAMISALFTVALAATQEPLNLLSLALTEDENGRPVHDWLHVPEFDEDNVILASLQTKAPAKQSGKNKKKNGQKRKTVESDINERPNKRQKVIEDDRIAVNHNVPVRFSFSATALYFAKYLAVQIEQGLPSSLMKAYLNIIDQLYAQHLSVGGKSDANITSISSIYIWVLKSYPIEQGFIVKTMLSFAMNNTASLDEKMTMAAEIIDTCLVPQDDDEDKLQVAASKPTKQAAMIVALTFFDSIIVKLTQKNYLQENLIVVMGLYKTFISMINIETDLRAIGQSLLNKLLSITEKLCKTSTSVLRQLRNGAAIERVFDAETSDITLAELLQELKALSSAALAWTERNRANLTKINTKKVPLLLFQIETLDVTILKFIHGKFVPEDQREELTRIFGHSGDANGDDNDNDVEMDSDAQSGTDEIDEEIDETTVFDNIIDEAPVRRPRKKTRMLRSRNRYIDDQLAVDADAEDDYADLEEWIVVKKGKTYV